MKRRKSSFLLFLPTNVSHKDSAPIGPQIKTLISRKKFLFCFCFSKYHLYLLLYTNYWYLLKGTCGGGNSYWKNEYYGTNLQGDTHVSITLVPRNKTDYCPNQSKYAKQYYIYIYTVKNKEISFFLYHTMFFMAHYNT